MAGEGSHCTVAAGAGDTAIGMLAGQQPSLPIESIAVALAAGLAEDLMTLGLRPYVQGIIGDITEDELAVPTVPDRPFSERQAGGDLLHWRVRIDESFAGCI
jgi:hypothetical protein